MKYNILLLLTVFSLITLASASPYSSSTGVSPYSSNINQAEAPINYSLIPTVNSSDYWDNRDTPADITYDEISGGDVNALGYYGYFNGILGVVGSLLMDGDPWFLSGTSLEIDEDLDVNGGLNVYGTTNLTGTTWMTTGNTFVRDIFDETHHLNVDLENLDRLYSNVFLTPLVIETFYNTTGDYINISAQSGETSISFNLASSTNSANNYKFDYTNIVLPLTAGTNTTPILNRIYVYLNAGVPTWAVSTTEPTAQHAMVSRVLLGDSGTIPYSASLQEDGQRGFLKRVERVQRLQGLQYLNGFDYSVSSTDLEINNGTYINGIYDQYFEGPVNVTGGFYLVRENGEYTWFDSFDDIIEYSDGTLIGNNKYFNIIFGITPYDGTGNIYAVVQSSPLVDYTSVGLAYADSDNTISIYPAEDFLKVSFIPVARMIIQQGGDAQLLPTGNYAIDYRGGVAGGASSGGGLSETDPIWTVDKPNYVPYQFGAGNINGSGDFTTTATGTFGNNYQAVLGDDGNSRAGYFTDEYGGYVKVGNSDASVEWFVDSYWSGKLGGIEGAGYFEDSIGNSVALADGTYAISSSGALNLDNGQFTSDGSGNIIMSSLYGVGGIYNYGDLSIDPNNRQLIASDGSTVMLDWSTDGTADFGDNAITTTGLGTFGDVNDSIVLNDGSSAFHIYGNDTNSYGKVDTGIDFQEVAKPGYATLSNQGAGNVDAGTHYYEVEYYTEWGGTGGQLYTGAPSITLATDSTVRVTIPVSDDYRVKGRRIYRTRVGDPSYGSRLLVDIENNDDTYYDDDIPDASLPDRAYFYAKSNEGIPIILIDGTRAMLISEGATTMGKDANAGGNGISIGYRAGWQSEITGISNVLIGYQAGDSITTGISNVVIGTNAGQSFTTTGTNTYVGNLAGQTNTGSNNVVVGGSSLRYGSGSYNTLVGNLIGSSAWTTATRNIGLGYSIYGSMTTGAYNNVQGWLSGDEITTGSYNQIIGGSAGDTLTTGDYNILLGEGADVSTADAQREGVLAQIDELWMSRGDNAKMLFGTEKDASIYYDGTNMIFNTSEVGDGIAYFTSNISVADIIDRTSVYDKSKGNALSFAKDTDTLKDTKGEIDHSKYYGYVKFNVTDYSRPEEETYLKTECNYTTNEFGDEEEICWEVEEIKTIYPHEMEKEGVSMSQEISLLRQQIYELKEINEDLTTRIYNLENPLAVKK